MANLSPFLGHSSSLALVALIASCIVLSVARWIKKHRKHQRYARKFGCRPVQHVRKHRIPGGVDLIRRAIEAGRRNQFPEELLKIYNEQGNETRHGTLGQPVLYTVECKNIQAITATQSAAFGAGNLRHKIYKPFIGNGIFALDGQAWEHTRATIRPSFARNLVAELALEEKHVQDMFEVLGVDSAGWTASVDLQPVFLRLTMDSATEFLFGDSLDSQKLATVNDGTQHVKSGTSFDIAAVADAFDGAMDGLGARMRLGEFYFLRRSPEWDRHVKLTHAFTDYYVQRALNAKSGNPSDEKAAGKLRLLNSLMETSKDPKVLREQVLTIIAAGRDTTAGLLGWTLWLLARHPDEYGKLRNVVIEAFGTYDKPSISFETLKRCQYLQWTLNESGRLYPVVPLNQRRTLEDAVLPLGGGPDGKSPLLVEKGTEVLFPHSVLHRRKDLWGDDAADFKPSRWKDRRFAWDFIPFSAGARICLGQQFALTEAGYVLVRLLQRYDAIENTDPAGMEAFHTMTVTTTPKTVQVRLHQEAR